MAAETVNGIAVRAGQVWRATGEGGTGFDCIDYRITREVVSHWLGKEHPYDVDDEVPTSLGFPGHCTWTLIRDVVDDNDWSTVMPPDPPVPTPAERCAALVDTLPTVAIPSSKFAHGRKDAEKQLRRVAGTMRAWPVCTGTGTPLEIVSNWRLLPVPGGNPDGGIHAVASFTCSCGGSL